MGEYIFISGPRFMKFILRLSSALALLLLLVPWSSAQASASGKSVASTKETDTIPSIEQVQAAIQREPRSPKLYIQLGQAHWNAGDYEAAFEAFKEAVKLAPVSAEAHNWMGAFLMGRGSLSDAISELRKAVSLDPQYVRGYTNLGSALAKSGDLAGAVTAFQKALDLDPNSWVAHLNLGLALRENGNAAKALVHLRRVAETQPDNPTLQCELGKTLRQNGDLSSAVAAFERALAIDPEMREAYYGLGFTLKQQGAAAHKTSESSRSTNPYHMQAQQALAKGDLSSAKELLGKALATNINDADAHNLLGYILGQQGDTVSALPHLERAAALRPASAEVHFNYGAALWYSGEKQKAISELKMSVRLDRSAAASYALLGMAQREESNWAEARVNLQRALALAPTTAATFVDLGIVFLRQNQPQRALAQFEAGLNANSAIPSPDWDDAISVLRETVSKTPDAPELHNMLGLILGRKGSASNEVLAEFREALRLRPNYAEAHNNMGLVLAQNGEDENATAEFREAVRIRPDFADAHANLGAVLTLADVEEAIGELVKAVSLDPGLVKAQFNLAEAYGNSPSHGVAKQIEQLRNIISVAPDFARAHLSLGKALLHDAKVNEAVAELREATRLEPMSGEAHYQLGLALMRSGKQEEAAAEVKKGRELSSGDERNQNAELDIWEGREALEKGELQQAESKFRHAIRLRPDSSVAQHLLAITLEKQDRPADALLAYEKAVELNPGDLSARQSVNKLKPPKAPVAQGSPLTHLEADTGGRGAADDPAKILEFKSYIRESRYKEVEPLLVSYVKENPDSSWGWYALGYSQFAQKQIGDSIKSLAQSLSLYVANPDAHKILGRDLMAIGRFDAAQKEFEQAIHYAPNSSESHYNLGKLFSLQDNWIAADKEFREAVRIDPSYLEAIDSLGFAQEALGNNDAAVQTYLKAIALNGERHGNFVAAHVNLSAYYNRTGDQAKALDYAEKALDLDPKSDSAWFQKAKAEERLGRLDAAADSLNHAVTLNPRSSSYFYVLSGVYRRLGKLEESKKALESFARLDQENSEIEKMRHNMSQSRSAPHPGGDHE
jgi:tetratricopeptide (TPR) repeat protein